SSRQIFLVALRVWFDSYRNDSLTELHGFQVDRSIFSRESITSGWILETYHSINVSRLCLVNWVFFVGVHLEKLGDTFLLLSGGIQNLVAGFDLSGVDTDISQSSEKRVSSNLER